MNKNLGGHLAVLGANVIFGMSVPITKSLIDTWISAEAYTALRLLFGALVFWGLGLCFKKENVSKHDLFILALGGLFGFLITQILFAMALRYTTPVYFSLIMSLTPVMVLGLSLFFLKENMSINKGIGVSLSIFGAALIILNSKAGGLGTNNALGILLTFLAALSYAVYTIVTRKVAKKYKPVTVTKWTFLFSALMLLPFELKALPEQLIFHRQWNFSVAFQLGFALIFATVIGFFLMPVGLKQIKASTVSIYMNFQPIVASVIAIFIGQDLFTWDKPFAAVLVISGVYMVTKKPRNSSVRHSGKRFGFSYVRRKSLKKFGKSKTR